MRPAAAPAPDEPLLARHYEDENFGRILVNCPIDLDDWSLDADLRAADRLLKSLGQKLRWEEAAPPMGGAAAIALSMPDEVTSDEDVPAGRSSGGSALPWTILCGSLVAFACGAVLLGWAYFGQRTDLWALGLPCILAGQAGLIIGLLLQIGGLSSSNRAAQHTLEKLDERLASLKEHPAHPPVRSSMPHFPPYEPLTMSPAELSKQIESLAARIE
jgi:hypothetical protein